MLSQLMHVIFIGLMLTGAVRTEGYVQKNSGEKEQIKRTQIRDRTVLLADPLKERPRSGYPVIVLLHGRGGEAANWFKNRGGKDAFCTMTMNEGFALVAPGAGEPWRKGVSQWDIRSREEKNQDIAFFRDLLKWIEENGEKYDSERIFICGFSNGGFMASRICSWFPEKIRAACIVAGGNAADLKLDKNGKPTFDPEENLKIPDNHPPVLIIHGKADRIVSEEFSKRYAEKLKKTGIPLTLELIDEHRHEWPEQMNQDIIQWFEYPPVKKSHEKRGEPDKMLFRREDSGSSVDLKPGQSFVVKLKGVPTGGYAWKIMEMDESLLNVEKLSEKDLAETGQVGGSTIFSWKFTADKPGKTRLLMKHIRPWEKEHKDAWTFELNITIK